jgi:predicted  nucleic acid-binding Zn-ribbon protein
MRAAELAAERNRLLREKREVENALEIDRGVISQLERQQRFLEEAIDRFDRAIAEIESEITRAEERKAQTQRAWLAGAQVGGAA